MHFLLFSYNILYQFAVYFLLEIIKQAKYGPNLLTAVKQKLPRSVKLPGCGKVDVEPVEGFSSGNLGVLNQVKSSQSRQIAMCPWAAKAFTPSERLQCLSISSGYHLWSETKGKRESLLRGIWQSTCIVGCFTRHWSSKHRQRNGFYIYTLHVHIYIADVWTCLHQNLTLIQVEQFSYLNIRTSVLTVSEFHSLVFSCWYKAMQK